MHREAQKYFCRDCGKEVFIGWHQAIMKGSEENALCRECATKFFDRQRALEQERR